jgi:hypothetical protein
MDVESSAAQEVSVDWRGRPCAPGRHGGMRAAVSLAANRRSLTFVFAGIIFAVAAYMLARTGIPPRLSMLMPTAW